MSHWLEAAAQIQVETALLSEAERLFAGHTAPSGERGGGREHRGLITVVSCCGFKVSQIFFSCCRRCRCSASLTNDVICQLVIC